MASTMKGCYYESFGTVDKVLKIGDLPVPDITEHDVLVKIHAASINPADCRHCEGSLRALVTKPFPILPGFDFSGVIVKKGDAVSSRLNVGDEVFGDVRGLRTGTTAEFIAVNEEVVTLKPASLSHKEAAGVPLAAITAFQCLEKAGLKYPPDADSASKSVFLTGGPGGVGTFIIQLAKKMFKVGTVVTTASAGAKTELCKSLGADEVIDYRSVDFIDGLKGRTFDVCVDCSHETVKMIPLVKENGGISTITGAPSGEMLREWLASLGPTPGFKVNPIVFAAVSYLPPGVINFFVGASSIKHKLSKGASFHSIITVPHHEILEKMIPFFDSHDVKVIIDEVFPLERAKEAYIKCAGGKAVGKVIVEVIA